MGSRRENCTLCASKKVNHVRVWLILKTTIVPILQLFHDELQVTNIQSRKMKMVWLLSYNLIFQNYRFLYFIGLIYCQFLISNFFLKLQIIFTFLIFFQASERIRQNLTAISNGEKVDSYKKLSSLSKNVCEHEGIVQINPLNF